jgi:hypothetical protein
MSVFAVLRIFFVLCFEGEGDWLGAGEAGGVQNISSPLTGGVLNIFGWFFGGGGGFQMETNSCFGDVTEPLTEWLKIRHLALRMPKPFSITWSLSR